MRFSKKGRFSRFSFPSFFILRFRAYRRRSAMPRFATREEYEAWKTGQSDDPYRAPTLPNPAPAAAAAPAEIPSGAGRGARNGSFLDSFKGLPGWAWCFVAPCLAIPAISLGGAVPFLIGFGAAGICAGIAKKEEASVAKRALQCGAVTAVAWAVFLGFAVWIASLR
jgi:hypothetical protein